MTFFRGCPDRLHGFRAEERAVLEWVTHGPRGNIVDLYTTLPWELLCEEVGKLRIDLRTGKVIAFPKAIASGVTSDSEAGGDSASGGDGRAGLLPSFLQSESRSS